MKNVVFDNAELGVAFDSASFNTVDNVTFTSTRPTDTVQPYTGSHGIWLKVRGKSVEALTGLFSD